MTHLSDQNDEVVVEELTFEEREALPPRYHVPHFDGLGEPHSWICAVCWDAETAFQTSWPCGPATTGGLELARAKGMSFSW